MNKENKILFGICLGIIFMISVTSSYAYFNTAIINDNVKEQTVTTGTLSLRYVDGSEINMQNIKPGATMTKTVYVANTGTLDVTYDLVWQELTNDIINDEMMIEATCTRIDGVSETVSGTCSDITTRPIIENIIKSNVSIEPNIVHKYDITITFKETNAEQNYNQGKNFTGTLGINEYVDNTTIYCTFDGEMVQGAEYVNEQYTYRYMQEGDSSESGLAWTNISDDGWGVQLTDKTSTEPVTSKLCTYINNKPVISMSYMFNNSKASTLNLSNFNTNNVTNMSYMFDSSAATTIDLSSFNTSNVTDMNWMFARSSVKILDLSSFNTSNVTTMNYMFYNSAVTALDLSSFNTNNVIDMNSMFRGSVATNINLSSFDTSNVTSMIRMFYNSAAIILDLSSFDTNNVTNMSYMFYNSTNLKTIYVSDLFSTNEVTSSTDMFYNTTNLVGGNGTKYNSSYVDKTYARIDGTRIPGYFTLKNN